MTQSIHAETTIGTVALIVTDLDRALAYYRQLGLQVHARHNGSARLGAGGDDLLTLHENSHAQRQQRSTGLYHFAILVPTRLELAQVLRNLAEKQIPVQGFSDHSVSEAIYLADPDGNGIEIYRDRPRDEWQYPNGRLQINTMPLNLESVLAELEHATTAWHQFSPGTTMGHIHLHVGDLAQTEAFYVDTLGFDLIARYGPSAMFVSAGGYHHHIGLNTWAGQNAPPPSPDSVGLRWYELRLPDQAALDAVLTRLRARNVPLTEQDDGVLLHDPSQNGILLRVK